MRTHLILVAVVALSACTVGPDYTQPEVVAPAHWHTGGEARVDADGVAAFWSGFGDPQLADLLARAIAGNRDLRVAVAHRDEARIRAVAAGSARWPRVDTTASYSNSRLSEHGFLEGLATGGPGGGGGGPGGAVFPGQQLDLHQVGFDASWELDLFGGLRRGVEAAEADAAAAACDLQAVQLALCGDVVDAYIEVRSLQQRAALADRLAAGMRVAVGVVDEQVRAGVAEAFERERARAELAASEADAAAAGGEVEAVVRRLEVLLGEASGALDGLRAPAPLPTLPDVLAIDVPAATLRRRPDVGAAERRLAAATARIGVATAELYPRFSLTGAFGLQSQLLTDLPRGDSRFWALGPQVRWPLFDFGRVRSAIAVQDARTAAALAEYEGAVLGALGDVEIALVRVARWRRQVTSLQAACTAARAATELAAERYRSGVLEYLDVLAAERERDRHEEARVDGEAALAHAVVALGKALGGGLDGAVGD